MELLRGELSFDDIHSAYTTGIVVTELGSIHQEKPWVAVTALVLLVNTNLLSMSTAGYASKLRLLLPAYLVEISNPYPESIRAAA